MNRRIVGQIIGGLLSLAALLVMPAGAQKAGTSASKARAETQIRALIEAFDQAINNADVEGSLTPYADDAETFGLLVFKFSTMAERRRAAEEAVRTSRVRVTRTMEPKIKVHGNWAWAYWTWRSETEDKQSGRRSSLDGRTTFILEKRRGQWKVVHSHISAPFVPGGPRGGDK